MVAMKAEYFYVLLGAVGMIAAAHYFPSLKKLDSLNLEHIDGIDLRALSVCRQKGLL